MDTGKNLATDISGKIEVKLVSTRDGFGNGVVEAGKTNKNIVVLCADVSESTRANWFAKEFPERFIEMGVAEQNMATVASGMANYGKIPFVASYAVFSPGRNWEQIRTTICINNMHVIIVGAHGGITVGPDGATHQALEDIALMRVLPNMTVIAPCDAIEAQKATLALANLKSPSYLRVEREPSPVITDENTPFGIGKAEIFREGKDATIIACGSIVYTALKAADQLVNEGLDVEVINNPSIKPLDERTILTSLKKTKALVTAEDHQIAGGMGSAVTELLAREYPVPTEFVGVVDSFGESGQAEELLKKYRLDQISICEAVKKVISRK